MRQGSSIAVVEHWTATDPLLSSGSTGVVADGLDTECLGTLIGAVAAVDTVAALELSAAGLGSIGVAAIVDS